MDIYSKGKRQKLMASVKNQDTTPEIKVRSILHQLGYRFRLHRKDLPGNPDIVLPKYSIVIFVNGCFWHGHSCRKGTTLPKSNIEFWKKKLFRNKQRDEENINSLVNLGWTCLTIWECELRNDHDVKVLKEKLVKLLNKH